MGFPEFSSRIDSDLLARFKNQLELEAEPAELQLNLASEALPLLVGEFTSQVEFPYQLQTFLAIQTAITTLGDDEGVSALSRACLSPAYDSEADRQQQFEAAAVLLYFFDPDLSATAAIARESIQPGEVGREAVSKLLGAAGFLLTIDEPHQTREQKLTIISTLPD